MRGRRRDSMRPSLQRWQLFGFAQKFGGGGCPPASPAEELWVLKDFHEFFFLFLKVLLFQSHSVFAIWVA